MRLLCLISFVTLFSLPLTAQSPDSLLYKVAGEDSLHLEIYRPADFDPDSSYPGIVFFFGGGWNGGNPGHLSPQAKHLASRGMVAICADYRTASRHGTTPFESLKDARSAMRYVKAHAAELSLDPARIGAGGGSAGGHLAAACALVEGFDDPQDDLSLSPRPACLVLFNPVVDNGPGGYGYERVSDSYHRFSPLHNVKRGAPPTIFFLGTEDRLIPVATGQYFQAIMQRVGSRCDLHLYANEGHGFFNPGRSAYYEDTVEKMDAFLVSLGWLGEG